MKLNAFFTIATTIFFSLASLATDATNKMNCPSISDISVEGTSYSAPTPEGKWFAVSKKGGKVKQFLQALYASNQGEQKGILINCSYELDKGDIDMRFYKTGEEDKERNLIVSIANEPHWEKEHYSISGGEQFYECTVEPTNCKFTPIVMATN